MGLKKEINEALESHNQEFILKTILKTQMVIYSESLDDNFCRFCGSVINMAEVDTDRIEYEDIDHKAECPILINEGIFNV